MFIRSGLSGPNIGTNTAAANRGSEQALLPAIVLGRARTLARDWGTRDRSAELPVGNFHRQQLPRPHRGFAAHEVALGVDNQRETAVEHALVAQRVEQLAERRQLV